MKFFTIFESFILEINNQQILIEKSFGISRYIYNYFLNKSENYINAYKYIKKLPNLIKENNWLKAVDSCLLRTSIFDLDNAYQKLKNARKYYLHKISKEIIEEHDLIVTEKLKIRKWSCKNCKSINERDLNANINIMFEGVKMYMKELQVG